MVRHHHDRASAALLSASDRIKVAEQYVTAGHELYSGYSSAAVVARPSRLADVQATASAWYAAISSGWVASRRYPASIPCHIISSRIAPSSAPRLRPCASAWAASRSRTSASTRIVVIDMTGVYVNNAYIRPLMACTGGWATSPDMPRAGPGGRSGPARWSGDIWAGYLARVVQQGLGAAGVPQLGKGLLLQLPDPLAGQAEGLANLVEGVRVTVVEAEPHRHDGGLPGRQRVQRMPQLVSHQLAVDQLGGLGRVDVLDEVADAGLAVLAD